VLASRWAHWEDTSDEEDEKKEEEGERRRLRGEEKPPAGDGGVFVGVDNRQWQVDAQLGAAIPSSSAAAAHTRGDMSEMATLRAERMVLLQSTDDSSRRVRTLEQQIDELKQESAAALVDAAALGSLQRDLAHRQAELEAVTRGSEALKLKLHDLMLSGETGMAPGVEVGHAQSAKASVVDRDRELARLARLVRRLKEELRAAQADAAEARDQLRRRSLPAVSDHLRSPSSATDADSAPPSPESSSSAAATTPPISRMLRGRRADAHPDDADDAEKTPPASTAQPIAIRAPPPQQQHVLLSLTRSSTPAS